MCRPRLTNGVRCGGKIVCNINMGDFCSCCLMYQASDVELSRTLLHFAFTVIVYLLNLNTCPSLVTTYAFFSFLSCGVWQHIVLLCRTHCPVACDCTPSCGVWQCIVALWYMTANHPVVYGSTLSWDVWQHIVLWCRIAHCSVVYDSASSCGVWQSIILWCMTAHCLVEYDVYHSGVYDSTLLSCGVWQHIVLWRAGVGPVLPAGQGAWPDHLQDPGGESADLSVLLQQCLRLPLTARPGRDVWAGETCRPLHHQQDDHQWGVDGKSGDGFCCGSFWVSMVIRIWLQDMVCSASPNLEVL